eukprot:2159581-Prymnesium_polylepis.1
MNADFGTCDTSGGTARQQRGTVVTYATLLLPTLARMDPRHSGVALTSTCGRCVAVDVVLGSLAEMPT